MSFSFNLEFPEILFILYTAFAIQLLNEFFPDLLHLTTNYWREIDNNKWKTKTERTARTVNDVLCAHAAFTHNTHKKSKLLLLYLPLSSAKNLWYFMIRNTDYCACLRFTLMTNTRITFFLSTYCNSLMKETKNSSQIHGKIGNSPLRKMPSQISPTEKIGMTAWVYVKESYFKVFFQYHKALCNSIAILGYVGASSSTTFENKNKNKT